jgi:chromosomal replication initiation ATPase DnaA
MDQQAIDGISGACDLSRLCRGGPVRKWAQSQSRVFQAVDEGFGIGREELRAATRGRHNVAVARQTGMYLARVALGMTLAKAGLLFGRDRTTASHACRVIEDRRDDPRFDALLQTMEAFVVHPESRAGRARQ